MSTVKTFDDKEQLAHAAAEAAVDILRTSIDTHGSATWILAGGSTPLAAYQIIATNHSDAIDWTKVTVMLGDERMGPMDGPFNNWHAIDTILAPLPVRRLRPRSDLSAEESARDYETYFSLIPKSDNGLPRLDLVWLGVGDDGHTLSLFPGHNSMFPSGNLIIPVHDSPKPPRDRISFSLRSLQGAKNTMVLASGHEKHAAVHGALSGNNLPIAIAVSIIETHEGSVAWYIDATAAN